MLLRFLNGSKTSDKISTESLLSKFKISSVNQLNAQAKLFEIWKAIHIPDYPLQIGKQTVQHEGATTRADANERTKEVGTSTIAQKTCISDAIRKWNIAPELLKNSKSLFQAKREIKNYERGLPI